MYDKATDPPIVTMIAGPNGSGKSTLTRSLQAAGIAFGTYINADEIDQALEGPAGLERSARAQKIAEERRRDCMARHASFTFETVMSHVSKIELLRDARRAGYLVVVYFIALEDPSLNVERVRQRVALGGHPVPEDRIVARYQRCLDLLPRALAEADRAVLFDNSYRDRANARVQLVPFCEVRRTPDGKHDYLSVDGGPIDPADWRIPRWSRPLLEKAGIWDDVPSEEMRLLMSSLGSFKRGQKQLRMLPKRSFNNIPARDYAEVNLGAIQKAIDSGKLTATEINQEVLSAAGLTRGGKDGVLLLSKGELTAKLNFTVAGASKGAVEAIEKAGGTLTIQPAKTATPKAKTKRGSPP